MASEKAAEKAPEKKDEMSPEDQAKLSLHIKTVAQLIYDEELRREDSLIQQSSHMQTAFSFFSAALFMVATIVVEHKGSLSYNFLLLVFSTITVLLLISLVLATLAQRRFKRNDYTTIEEAEKSIIENYKTLDGEAAKDLQYVGVLKRIQAQIKSENQTRVCLIQWSMRTFYFAIGLSVFWFFVALTKMIG